MGRRLLTVLGTIAAIGLIGGVLLAALGVLTAVQVRGGSVLGWVTALSVITGELLLAAVVIVLAALLLRAVSVLSAPRRARTRKPRETRGHRRGGCGGAVELECAGRADPGRAIASVP